MLSSLISRDAAGAGLLDIHATFARVGRETVPGLTRADSETGLGSTVMQAID